MESTTGEGHVSELLDRIDDVLEDRCACDCGTVLTATGTSGYFVDETHQKRWARRQAADDDPWADVAEAWENAPADPRTVTVADLLAINGLDPGLAAHPMQIGADEITVDGGRTYPLTVPAEEIYIRGGKVVGVKLGHR